MSIESDSDRAALLADFGEVVAGPTGVGSFTAIAAQDRTETLDAQSPVWHFIARTTDITALSEGDRITRAGGSYDVENIRAPDNGLSEIVTVKRS